MNTSLATQVESPAMHILHSLAEQFYIENPQSPDIDSRRLIDWSIRWEIIEPAELATVQEFTVIRIHRDRYL